MKVYENRHIKSAKKYLLITNERSIRKIKICRSTIHTYACNHVTLAQVMITQRMMRKKKTKICILILWIPNYCSLI